MKLQEGYLEFLKLLGIGDRHKANCIAEEIVKEYQQNPDPAFVVSICRDATNGRINHHLWSGIVLPFAKESMTRDPRAVECLLQTQMNLRTNPTAWEQLEYITEMELLERYLQLCPSDEWAISRKMEAIASWLSYTIHEWPLGVLYGCDGATEQECDEILANVSELRVLDKMHKYLSLCNDVESKTLEYRAALRVKV